MLSQHTAKHWLSVITPSLCLHGCDAAPLHLRCTRWAELKCHQDTWFFRDWNGANTKLPKLVGTQFIHVYADPSMLSAPPHSPVSRLRRTFYFYLLLFLISQRNSKKPALHWLPIVCACVCVHASRFISSNKGSFTVTKKDGVRDFSETQFGCISRQKYKNLYLYPRKHVRPSLHNKHTYACIL